MTFTDDLWAATLPIRNAIDRLPFVVALEDGTLSEDKFTYYLEQDALYLGAYARVLAAAGAQSSSPDHLIFWSERAASAIQVERTLHESFVDTSIPRVPSPTCTAYTSYLLSLVTSGSLAALVGGILPCFWIYEDVGRRLKSRISGLANHPFEAWITTYDDPAFTAAANEARAIVDEIAEQTGPREQHLMQDAFTTAARYEWMFWDAAWRKEIWPV
ncbi:TenA family protein [Microbacterium sp. HA-8]|uniref:TenA family protein n=1 Tax=Microbacterium sp. HA-8 TaxID=3234200 RepID=UPI0038F6EF39